MKYIEPPTKQRYVPPPEKPSKERVWIRILLGLAALGILLIVGQLVK